MTRQVEWHDDAPPGGGWRLWESAALLLVALAALELMLLCAAARPFRAVVGPLLLAGLAVVTAWVGQGWLTAADCAFLGVLAATLLARWLEFYAGEPPAAGEAEARAQLWRALAGTAVAGLALWCAANVVGNHLLDRPAP
jgi:hypothetical protein